MLKGREPSASMALPQPGWGRLKFSGPFGCRMPARRAARAGRSYWFACFDSIVLVTEAWEGCGSHDSLRMGSRCRSGPSRSVIGRARIVRGLPGGSLGRAGRQHRSCLVSASPWRALLSHNQKLRSTWALRRAPPRGRSRQEGAPSG